jgi:predicted acyltransferase (DUF342 family)
MRKYELTTETKSVDDKVLYRIRRLNDDLIGGFIESEKNLSHDGDSMVYDNAMVYGDAIVSGDATVYGNSIVCGNATVSGDARVYGDTKVSGDAKVYGDARVYGDAKVYGNARVSGDAKVYGDAMVSGNARVYGDARVCGDAMVSGGATVSEFCNNFIFEEHNITITDNHMRIGCQQHLKTEWPNLIEGLIEEHRVKHPEVYRSFVNLFCNVYPT